MRYIARSYLYIETDWAFREIIQTLLAMGYIDNRNPEENDLEGGVIIIEDGVLDVDDNFFDTQQRLTSNVPIDNQFIDPYDFEADKNKVTTNAIKLFLELAQMGWDTNTTQWHQWGGQCYKGRKHLDSDERAMTPLEVAQAFKDGRIQL